MFAEEDGTSINNEDRKEFQISKNAKRALGKISLFENFSSGI